MTGWWYFQTQQANTIETRQNVSEHEKCCSTSSKRDKCNLPQNECGWFCLNSDTVDRGALNQIHTGLLMLCCRLLHMTHNPRMHRLRQRTKPCLRSCWLLLSKVDWNTTQPNSICSTSFHSGTHLSSLFSNQTMCDWYSQLLTFCHTPYSQRAGIHGNEWMCLSEGPCCCHWEHTLIKSNCMYHVLQKTTGVY